MSVVNRTEQESFVLQRWRGLFAEARRLGGRIALFGAGQHTRWLLGMLPPELSGGVVVVLDRRVMSKRYGNCFLDSLPDCTEYRGPLRDLPAKAARWIAGDRVEGTTLMSQSAWRRKDEEWW